MSTYEVIYDGASWRLKSIHSGPGRTFQSKCDAIHTACGLLSHDCGALRIYDWRGRIKEERFFAQKQGTDPFQPANTGKTRG